MNLPATITVTAHNLDKFEITRYEDGSVNMTAKTWNGIDYVDVGFSQDEAGKIEDLFGFTAPRSHRATQEKLNNFFKDFESKAEPTQDRWWDNLDYIK